MKTKTAPLPKLKEPFASPHHSFASKNVDSGVSSMTPLLKEIRGSMALEGLDVSDERMVTYAAEFERAKQRGEVDKLIDETIREVS
jgi:hypothetical protein